ncbi:hypothetical protein N7522_006295 [Penicillium canescens]|nr:hypothetical protein N7522_006295 [Penicillium canescens]
MASAGTQQRLHIPYILRLPMYENTIYIPQCEPEKLIPLGIVQDALKFYVAFKTPSIVLPAICEGYERRDIESGD